MQDANAGEECSGRLNLYFKLERKLEEKKVKYSKGQTRKCVQTSPKWNECSDRREPESLNVHWMAINVQYSAQYVNMFSFEPNVVFVCIDLVITPDDTGLFVCKHRWVKVNRR